MRKLVAFLSLGIYLTTSQVAYAERKKVVLQMPDYKMTGNIAPCELTPDIKPKEDVKIRPLDKTAKGKLVIGGGGWDSSFYRNPFAESIKAMGDKAKVALVLSASKAPEGAAGAYYAWRDKFLDGKSKVVPVYTTGSDHKKVSLEKYSGGGGMAFDETRSDPNGDSSTLVTTTKKQKGDEKKLLEKIEVSTNPSENLGAFDADTTHVILEGGMPPLLFHLVGSTLIDKAREVYKRGGVVYGSSAGANIINGNMSKMWPAQKSPKDEEQVFEAYTNPSKYFQLPMYEDGYQISDDFDAMSHYLDPRLLVSKGWGPEPVETTTTLANGDQVKTQTSIASNPYAFVDGFRQMMKMKPNPMERPAFAIPEKSYMTYQNGVAEFHAPTGQQRFFIFDPRFPPTDSCPYYFVKSGTKFDLAKGLIIPPSKLLEDGPAIAEIGTPMRPETH